MATPFMERSFYMNGQIGSAISFDKVCVQNYTERELSNLLTDRKISGLSPGETYGIVLKTKTGGRFTRRPIFETVMTKPMAVESLTVEEVTPTNAILKWVAPEGHKKLRAFRLLISSFDNKIKRELIRLSTLS